MDRDNINNGDQGNNNTTQSHWTQQHHPPHRTNSRRVQQSQPHQTHPPPQQQPPCPRCSSTDTKFGYYNNYNLTQPRYFCKGCKRYWTHGGALRNVPVGGGSRKTAKRPRLSPPPNTTTQPPHELSRFGILNPAKVLEIGEGSALSSVPVTTAALSISQPTSSTSSLAASPLMINYLNPNYPHLSQGEDRHNGFFTSLIEFQGMNAAPSSQPFFTPPPAASASASVSSKLYNLGPLFHFSPFPAQEPPGWRRQSFLTAAAGEHHQVFNQPPGRVPVTSVEDGALVVKDDEVRGRSSGCSEKGTDQQPDASKYGRDGNQ